MTLPAHKLHRDVLVVLDREASSELKMLDYYEWIQNNMVKAP